MKTPYTYKGQGILAFQILLQRAGKFRGEPMGYIWWFRTESYSERSIDGVEYDTPEEALQAAIDCCEVSEITQDSTTQDYGEQ